MNNHKLIMEGWRQFLNEDAGNQESGILTGAILQYFTDIVREMMQDKRVVNAGKRPYPPNKESYTKIKKTMPGYDDFVKLADPESDRFEIHMNKYIDKSSVTKRYFKIFKSRSSLLKKLKTFKLEITRRNTASSKFRITNAGGSVSTNLTEFTVKIDVSGFIEPWHTEDNFAWMKNYKHSLQGMTQHEVEHLAQGKRGEPMQDILNMVHVARGGALRTKDPLHLLASFIMDIVFQKDDTKAHKERVLKRWEKWLKGMQYIIDDEKGHWDNETVVSKIITYYTQEIEQQAYAVGYVRAAKSRTESELRTRLKNDPKFKKEWFSMSKEERKKWKSTENSENFSGRVDTKMSYLRNKVRGKQHEKELLRVIYELEVIIKDYAFRRFGSIKPSPRNLLNPRR